MGEAPGDKELIGERAELKDGVVGALNPGSGDDALNKFIPYYFYPESTYTMAVTRSKYADEGVGGDESVDEAAPEELVNLAEVCGRFGGGGHARVGAISWGAAERWRGRRRSAEGDSAGITCRGKATVSAGMGLTAGHEV